MDPKIQKVLDSQTRTVTVLSCLIAIQESFGYLVEGAIPAVAQRTGASVNDAYSVATFYTHFRFQPPGEHQIELCWGPSCQIFRSDALMKQAEEFAGIKFNGTTPDKKYTLRGLECAGACALAPVGKLDGTLVGRLTPEKLRERLIAMRQNGGGGHHG